MNILSEEEWMRLKKVKTTIDQARRIKIRNAWLLRGLRKIPLASVEELNAWAEEQQTTGRPIFIIADSEIGCPHCDRCDECAWLDCGMARVIEPCLDVKFGGISYNELQTYPLSLNYYDDSENITLQFCTKYDKDDLHLLRKQCEEVERFLLGHIEWVERMYPQLKEKKS